MATDTPVAGIDTYFALGTAATPGTAEEVSQFLDGVESSVDADELDGTTFRKTNKIIIPGFRTRSYSLSGKWSRDAHMAFKGLEGLTGVAFEYGPEGDAIGDVLISGTVSVLSYSGPVASVDGITTFTVELRVETYDDDVFAAAREPVAPATAPAAAA